MYNSRVLIRLLQISYKTKYGICSLFTGKCNFSVGTGGAFAHFFYAPPWGFWVNRPVHHGGFEINARGKRGMGTLGIAWTITDQAGGQDDWILAKFLCPFLLTELRATDSHLDRTSLVNKGFISMAEKTTIFLGNNARNPEPAWIQPHNNWTLTSRVNYSPQFFWLTCALICDRGEETFSKHIPNKNKAFKTSFYLTKKR